MRHSRSFCKSLTGLNADVCNACGKTERTQLDRRLPKRFGGSYTFTNVQFLCIDCHARKSALECYLAISVTEEKHTEWFDLAYPKRFASVNDAVCLIDTHLWADEIVGIDAR